jgi:hypothetical protein
MFCKEAEIFPAFQIRKAYCGQQGQRSKEETSDTPGGAIVADNQKHRDKRLMEFDMPLKS